MDTGPVSPTVLRRHPVATFCALTYVVAWTLWLPLVILQDRMPPVPDLVLRVLGSSAPSALAVILVARLHGRAEVRCLLRRLLKGRVSIGWYVAIVALTDHEAYERRAAKRSGSMPNELKAARRNQTKAN